MTLHISFRIRSLIAASLLFAGCGGSQPPIGAVRVVPSNSYMESGGTLSAARSSTTIHYLYVTASLYKYVFGYAINASNGALAAVNRSPFRARESPLKPAIDPTGAVIYVPNENSDNISAFVIHPKAGRLTHVPGQPLAAGVAPWQVAIDPTGKFAYVVNWGSDNVSAYTINARSGALTPVKGSPFEAGSSPTGVATARAGSFVYVTSSYDDDVSAYVINTKSVP